MDTFLLEHTREYFVEMLDVGRFLPYTAKQFDWKRVGDNHWSDATISALMLWRYLARDETIIVPLAAQNEQIG